MKIKSRRDLCLTGLKYNSEIQDYQEWCYHVITQTGDLKYNLLYELAAEERIKPDSRLAGLFRMLVAEIRLRERELKEAKEHIEELESQIQFERRSREVVDEEDVFDEDGKVKGYCGA